MEKPLFIISRIHRRRGEKYGDAWEKYVADVIGEEYWNWEATDKIFITAPTGSGKTYFVLRNLIKRAIANKENIVYFVNRKILKKQLQKEMDDIYAEMLRNGHENADMLNGIITLMTYQQLEIMISNKSAIEVHDLLVNWCTKYEIAVFDECHYFYADSNFNTFTELLPTRSTVGMHSSRNSTVHHGLPVEEEKDQ